MPGWGGFLVAGMSGISQRGRWPVREIEHHWIGMPDGVRLAARIWLPEGAGAVPAILECIPYRKRDMVRARDEGNHPFLASTWLRLPSRGHAGVGDSEGVMRDMYASAELDDARRLIDWIARQEWCNGRVGMFGTSWGGTASLQAAVDAPEPLKAVIANCATIDRFEDDIHWMGGCVLTDTLEWGATLPAILAAPPDAATVGDGWFGMWEHRLRNMRFPHENWLRETRRDPYWRHGSVRFDADRLGCPILAIGGWSDRYSNSVMPLVEARPDICRGIVGPWGHHYPDRGEPGPAIDFRAVALEWWDCWLRSEAPAMPDWPAMRLWRREFDPPRDRLTKRNGTWIEIDRPKEAVRRRFHLGDGELQDWPTGKAVELTVPDNLRHGQCAGDTGYFGRVGGLPLDQVPDDECSLRFDSRQLGADLCIVGRAKLSIDLTPEASACPACVAVVRCRTGREIQSHHQDNRQPGSRRWVERFPGCGSRPPVPRPGQIPDHRLQGRPRAQDPTCDRLILLAAGLAVRPSIATEDCNLRCRIVASASARCISQAEATVPARRGPAGGEGVEDRFGRPASAGRLRRARRPAAKSMASTRRHH